MIYTARKKQKDERIVKFVEKRGTDFSLEDKIKFLTQGMQYEHLRVGANKSKHPWEPVRKCSEERISSVVESIYQGARERLDKKLYTQGELFGGEK